ncbi:MAG: PilZ domain-containing protein [Desulfomonilaceae bacterium]
MAKRTVSAKEILTDIKTGMDNSALMQKYGLSEKGLQSLFKKLVTLKAISHSELYERSKSYRERIDHIRKRKFLRAELTIRLPIYELESGDKGILRDISENGLRVAGIEATVGQAKTFQIPVDMYVESDPLLVLAECKWVEIRHGGKEYFVAGFEIMDLSESDSEILQNFIGCLLLSESGQWQTIDLPDPQELVQVLS